MLLLDLDGFKPVNDTYGHAAGDEVLQAVAGRIRAQVRADDTVARLGGDEFAIVAPRATARSLAASGVAARIDLALQERHLIHGELVAVGASVGFHLAAADDVDPLQRADEAMYEAKRRRHADR